MSQRLHWKTAVLYGSAVLLGIILGPFLSVMVGGLWASVTQPTTAEAAAVPAVAITAAALSPDSPDAVFVCTPKFVGVFKTRINVLCTVAAPGGIFYFATPTSDSKNAARVLSVLLTAKALAKNVQIYYTANASGAAYGCQTNDCRPIDAVEVMD